MNQTTDTAGKPITCPTCGHENIPGAAFCSRCGISLCGDAPDEPSTSEPPDDTETTTAYRPIVDASQPPQSSPWAPPGTTETIIDVDTSAEQTSAIPITRPAMDHRPAPAPEPSHLTAAPREQAQSEGMRGFFLGVVGLILIGVVITVYIYAAWLSDSTRDTIDGWLPWVS